MVAEITTEGLMPRVKSGVGYLMGLLIIMNGVGILAMHSVGSGLLLLCGGVFLFPITRRTIESRLDTELTLMVAASIFLLFFFAASVLLLMNVDVAEEGPEMLAPYF